VGKSKEVTIGYKYSAGMHMIICHGPVDAVLAITAGEKLAWSGNVTGSKQIYINNPELFGGEKKEGGIVGAVDIEFGGSTQGQNGYLVSRLGSNIPSHRGVLGLVLRKVYLTAMSQYIKPWSILVRRIASKDWATSYSNIAGGSNPAHIIREVLTHKSWGMGLPTAKIDDASFTAAAIALYNEGFGLSLSLNGQTQCEDFILNILKHISAVMYNDRITGNYKLKLIRNDYNIATIPSFNEDNIISFNSFERPQFAEMVNEVIIVYQPQGQKDKQSVSIQDLSSIQAQGGVVSQTIDYVGIDNQGIASRVAQRDLRQYSTPLAQLRITVNRDGWKLEPGAVFKLTWASHGITDMVCRATNINLGDYKGHQIVVDAVEDIFSLPTTSYLTTQTPQWVDPVGSPVAAPSQEARELPYWDIQRQFNPGYLAEVDSLSGYVQFLAETPTVASPGYILDTKPSSVSTYTQQEEFGYVPKAKLLADITYTQTSMSLKDVTGNLEDVAIGTYAYIENEIVRIDSINLSTLVVTMGRGCLDSVPKPHAANAPIWFADDFAGVDFTEWLVGDSVNCKALTKTGSGVLSEAAAPVSTVTMAGRQFKPYPPGKLRINNLAYPSQIAGALSISWAHRDRTQQLASILSEEYGNVGPEAGLTYSLKLYDEKNVLRVNQTGLTASTYSWTTEAADSLLTGRLNEYVKINLWSVRGGIASSQMHDLTIYRPQAPFNIIRPYVSGIAAVGEVLSVSDGTWDFSPTSYTYQWTKDYAPIPLADSNQYLITDDDNGYSIRCIVTAINSVGSTPEESSNAVVVGVPVVRWTIADRTSDLWLDASDSSTIVIGTGVSSWSDKSGNGKVAIQNTAPYQPSVVVGKRNGLDVIRFNNHYLFLPDSLSLTRNIGAITIFAVASNEGGSSYRTIFNANKNAAPFSRSAMYFRISSLEVGGRRLDADSYQYTSLTQSGLSICMGQYNYASAALTIGLNGTLLDRSGGFQTSGLTSDTDSIYVSIGSDSAGVSTLLGDICEIVVIKEILSAEDRQKIEGYLAWKWGLVDDLPADHPYKTHAPVRAL